MHAEIHRMTETDRTEVLKMMRVFYNSDAVLSNGSEEIFNADIENCVNGSPYLEGYVFKNNEEYLGYAMVAKSFSTEFGKPCVWIEDIYILPQYRGNGIAGGFFGFLDEQYPDRLQRLEAERENENAIKTYEKNGFSELPYIELVKNTGIAVSE